MTSANGLSLILRRLDEIERKLDHVLEELRTPPPSAIRCAGVIFQARITSRSPILAALVLGLGRRSPTGNGTREKHVSRISVWRYVRPFVCNNNYRVCDCNRITYDPVANDFDSWGPFWESKRKTRCFFAPMNSW